MYNKTMELLDKKRFYLVLIISISLNSCATNEPIRGTSMTSKDFETFEIIDFVETNFESTKYVDKNTLLKIGYNELLTIAQNNHKGEIDIMNIILEKKYSKRNLWYSVETLFTGVNTVTGHYISVHAKGVVVNRVGRAAFVHPHGSPCVYLPGEGVPLQIIWE